MVKKIREAAKQRGLPIREVAPAEFDRVAAGQVTQGVAARIRQPPVKHLDDVLSTISSSPRTAFLLALDQVQDPHNFGALLRTAEGAGIQGVVVPERRSAPVTGIVTKVSAGAVNHLPIVEVKNLSRALENIREAGIWVVGLDGLARDSLFGADLTVPLVLVLGSEGQGLRRLTREHCDLVLRLPMYGSVASLNASVAGSIAMYEVVRQREPISPSAHG